MVSTVLRKFLHGIPTSNKILHNNIMSKIIDNVMLDIMTVLHVTVY